jgi:ketosteroid isomerase-like protein
MTINATVRSLPFAACRLRSVRARCSEPAGGAGARIRFKAGLSRIGLLVLVSAAGVSALATESNALAQVHAHKEHKRDYKHEIEAAEGQWRIAQLAGDAAAMDKLMAEDYFGISVSGQLNDKMQQLERVRSRSLVISKLDVSDVKIKLVGRVAIVTSLAEIAGMSEGEPLKGRFRYTRVYKRYPDGTWKITNFEVTRVPEAG